LIMAMIRGGFTPWISAARFTETKFLRFIARFPLVI
jgi:hypothetical protein